MSDYMFGLSYGNKPTRKNALRIERIAKKHNARFIEMQEPGQGYKHWFAGPNLGNPFDQDMARAINTDLNAAGLIDDKGKIKAGK